MSNYCNSVYYYVLGDIDSIAMGIIIIHTQKMHLRGWENTITLGSFTNYMTTPLYITLYSTKIRIITVFILLKNTLCFLSGNI